MLFLRLLGIREMLKRDPGSVVLMRYVINDTCSNNT